jgi:para-nitrobenzyl esterase
MRFLIGTALLVSIVPAAAFAQTAPAPTAPAAATTGYSVEDTDIGTLLDDPAAKAVLDKHIPGFSTKDQIDLARSMTLKGIQQYAPDMITDKLLSDIQVDLSKLPVKK